MTKFIELHIFHTGIPVYVNVDSIVYMVERNTALRIYLNVQTISTHENSGMVKKIDGEAEHIDVQESYAKVKSLIED